MNKKISIEEIYDKNINVLIGSGASFGLFPTLSVNIKDDNGNKQTIESLFQIKHTKNQALYNKYLFAYYYETCIKKVMEFNAGVIEDTNVVIKNYKRFIKTIIKIMDYKKHGDHKVCNIFNTNYDGCFEYASDDILKEKTYQFIVNDGTSGFKNKYFDVNNFYISNYRTGVTENHKTQIPQINHFHPHGSLHWYKEEDKIKVDYSQENQKNILNNINSSIKGIKDLKEFCNLINNENSTLDQLKNYKFPKAYKAINKFYKEYKKLPIINPTNKKFRDTLIESYYYEMLRHLSFELEKPNSILIAFGFSFADDHILQIVKRSLANPTLQMFICCYNNTEYERLNTIFGVFNNVELIKMSGELDFTVFNQAIFTFENKDKEK